MSDHPQLWCLGDWVRGEPEVFWPVPILNVTATRIWMPRDYNPIAGTFSTEGGRVSIARTKLNRSGECIATFRDPKRPDRYMVRHLYTDAARLEGGRG